MSRPSGRGRYHGHSGMARTREQHPIVEAFRFLADSCFDKGGEIGNIEWKPQEYVFPFSNDHSEVTLSDYYGDVHYNLLNKTPKSLSYKRCNTEENVIKMKIEALLKEMCKKASGDTQCRLEVDFIKMLLTSPKGFGSDSLTIAELQRQLKEDKSRLRINIIRAYLPSGPDVLVGILENLGAKLIREEKSEVKASDLVFRSWQSITYPEGAMCLANPRLETDVCDNDIVCDIRIKGKTKAANKADDLHELWNNRGLTPPPTLTEPGLNHLFRRNSTNDGFVVDQNAHINALLEKTNRIGYIFEMEGFTVALCTSDGREYDVDGVSGRNELKYSYECWPKLVFFGEDEERIPQLVDLAYRCIITLFDALAERRLEARPWRCFIRPCEVNLSTSKVQVYRRILVNDTLDEMLGVPGEKNPHVLKNRLHEVLKEMEDVDAISSELDPIELRKKLIRAADENGIKTEKKH